LQIAFQYGAVASTRIVLVEVLVIKNVNAIGLVALQQAETQQNKAAAMVDTDLRDRSAKSADVLGGQNASQDFRINPGYQPLMVLLLPAAYLSSADVIAAMGGAKSISLNWRHSSFWLDR
jgi:hypothetical protein